MSSHALFSLFFCITALRQRPEQQRLKRLGMLALKPLSFAHMTRFALLAAPTQNSMVFPHQYNIPSLRLPHRFAKSPYLPAAALLQKQTPPFAPKVMRAAHRYVTRLPLHH